MDRAELTRLLGHVSASVGHQVINSLSTIVSQAEILRTLAATPDKAPDLRERIETIIRASLDTSTMTRRLLELSHELTSIENPESNTSLENLDLRVMATELADSDRIEFGPSVNWVLDLNPTPAVKGDRAAIGFMLNLIAQNAVEALLGSGGTITLCTRPGPRDWALIEIRDNGQGMSPEVLEHATEPFFTTRNGHRGLGLTIARGIWRRHRGSMVIESQPGDGTTIRLVAPPASSH